MYGILTISYIRFFAGMRWSMETQTEQKIIEIRRKIHQHPELAFCEHETGKLISDTLDELGIPYRTGVGKTGIMAELAGGRPGKTIALRADMDALLIQEAAEVPFRSRIDGQMHACGHDAHVACLLGCAMLLKPKMEGLAGNVRLLFQPAEEATGGAEPMILDGALDGADACAALHVAPERNTGTVALRDGAMYASPDDFTIVVCGKGGHGAHPEDARNPIPAACAMADRIQQVQYEIKERTVVTICAVNGGTCTNVIPETVTVLGTARSLSPDVREELYKRIKAVVEDVAQQYEVGHTFDFRFLYPPLINNASMAGLLRRSAAQVIGAEHVLEEALPSMGGEDFAYFAQKLPSVLFHLGCSDGSERTSFPVHSPYFCLDENCLKVGSQVLCCLAMNYLNQK